MKVVPYGKYAGKPVEVLLTDIPYAEFLYQTQELFLREKHPEFAWLLSQIPQTTGHGRLPDQKAHNLLLKHFFDDRFRAQFLYLYILQSKGAELAGQLKKAAMARPLVPAEHYGELEWSIQLSNGIGVGSDIQFQGLLTLQFKWFLSGNDAPLSCQTLFDECPMIHIELKPAIGENLDAVAKQVKANRATAILVDQLTTSTLSLAELRKYFRGAGAELLLLEEVVGVPIPEAPQSPARFLWSAKIG